MSETRSRAKSVELRTAERDEGRKRANGRRDEASDADPRPHGPQPDDVTQTERATVRGPEAGGGGPLRESPRPERQPRPVRTPSASGPTPVRLGAQTTLRERNRRSAALGFHVLCAIAAMIGVIVLAILLGDVVHDGIRQVDRQFLTSFASRFPERAGIKAALIGSLWMLGLTALIAFPLSVGAAIYLEEYARRNWFTRVIQINIANLAGVPSIVYGILGLALFVRSLGLGRSLLSGALTLSLLILPVLILASQEAIRAVPDSLRQAALGLGATRWQTVRLQVLPMALPGILTGTILALSRAVGETAPLVMIGALSFVAFTPKGPLDQFTVLPLQIFNWVSRPQEEFRQLAAGAIIVLLALLLLMNTAAILLRNRYQRHGR